MPKVSVIIPTYNRRQLVRDAIESVLNQSLKNFELIIVDDGSTDNTSLAVKVYDDIRIRFFYKKNGGVSSARNMGMDEAKGEYIAFLDSDDLWPKSYLHTMVSLMNNNMDYGVAYTTIDQHFPDGSIIPKWALEHCVSGWVTKKLFAYGFVYCSSSIIRSKVLSNIRFDENFNKDEDFDFFLRLSLNTKFLFVPDAQVIRRVQINSLSRHENKRKVSLNKAKILNNFYYNLGGDKTVPKSLAMREISRIYRKAAFRYYEDGKPDAAIPIFKKAVSYNKFESKNYYGLLKALISSKTYNKL